MDPTIESRISRLEDEIRSIHERNVRVETDKQWETSILRRAWLVILTYGFTALVFWLIGVDRFLLNALIPTSAYWLSTLSLPVARQIWDRRARAEGESEPDRRSAPQG